MQLVHTLGQLDTGDLVQQLLPLVTRVFEVIAHHLWLTQLIKL